MNLYFCKDMKSEQIYKGKYDVDAMYRHILNQNLIRCCNEHLYFYYHKEGRYIKIEKLNEWHTLSCFFDRELCTEIHPKNVSEIVARLKNNSDIQVHIGAFDKNINLINLRNGVLNYITGEILQKNQEYMFTYQLNVNYISHKDDIFKPNFDDFCKTSLDNDKYKIKLLLQIIGYLCTPLMNAKKCFIFLGEPNSGKSLMLHLIEHIFGKDAISNIPLENLNSRFSSGVLSSKRLNMCAELSARPLRNIETFKLIVGGDTLSGEFKGKDVFEFENKCKLLYAGNILPPIKNEDISSAFTERLVVLRFSHTIPENERNYNLISLLQDEVDSIFSVAINTILALIRNKYAFEEPDDSKVILKDYAFLQKHIDVFLKEWCDLDINKKIHSITLYNTYKEFCRENAINPISHQMFSQKVCSLYGVKADRFRINGSNSMRGFYGIAVKDIYTQDSER